jgi:glycosyltransferase involved in cell wall biosynthesis
MVSDFYPPFIGGAERQVQLLSWELIRRGHEVKVATVWHDGLPEQQDDSGIAVRRLKGLTTRVPWFSKDPKRRYHPPFPDPGIVQGLRQFIQRWQPDVVHAHGWIAYSCSVALLGKKIPLVISVRDYGYTCAQRTLLHKGQVCTGPEPLKCLQCATHAYGFPKSLAATTGVFSGRVILKRKLSAIHSVSTFVQQIVRRDLLRNIEQNWKYHQDRIPDIVAPSMLVESNGVAPVQEYSAKLPTQPYILFVGALQPHKGLGPLIAAYQRLNNPPPMVLIGTAWPDTPSTWPPGVTVLHNVPHQAVMVAWERCLFGVAPSVWPDPLPGVVREAMSKGKAILATQIGGNTDMILPGETGLFVPPDDVDALTVAMQQLIDDPELRQRLGQAAMQSLSRFTPNEVLPLFEDLYHQVVR